MDEPSAREGGQRRLRDCTSFGWPSHAVYFFIDDEEARLEGATRAVRVGTHALSATSATTLWQRLSTHRGHVSGSRPGGGNHRASIFRLHVGTAMLARGDWPSAVRNSWRNKHASPAMRHAEYPLEQAVSHYISGLPLLWLDVPARTDRGLIEQHHRPSVQTRRGRGSSLPTMARASPSASCTRA